MNLDIQCFLTNSCSLSPARVCVTVSELSVCRELRPALLSALLQTARLFPDACHRTRCSCSHDHYKLRPTSHPDSRERWVKRKCSCQCRSVGLQNDDHKVCFTEESDIKTRGRMYCWTVSWTNCSVSHRAAERTTVKTLDSISTRQNHCGSNTAGVFSMYKYLCVCAEHVHDSSCHWESSSKTLLHDVQTQTVSRSI